MVTLLLLAVIVQFEERKLATLPEGAKPDDAEFRDDGAAVAYILEGRTLMVGDRKVAEDERFRELGWSPDGRLYYSVKNGARWRMVIGDERGDEFDGLWSPSFSADGKHAAYRAKTGKKFVMVVDGKRSAEYDEISLGGGYGYEGSARALAYEARSGDQWHVIVGDCTSGPCEKVGLRASSADRSVYAHVVVKDGKSRVLVGDTLSAPFDDILLPALSMDGRVLAFTAEAEGKRLVVFGERRIATDCGSLTDLAISGDGKHVAYGGGSLRQVVVVVDERRIEPKGAFMVRSLMFRPDGGDVAFEFMRGDAAVVWAAGAEGEAFQGVRWLNWTLAGEIAYVGRRPSNKEVLVVGAKAGPECDFVRAYRESPKGVLVSLVEKSGKHFVRIGDRESAPFEHLWRVIRFSGDGKRVCFAAAVGREIRWKVLDVP